MIRVITPNNPSEPIKRCLRSNPELFFINRFIDETIVPSANTASRPKTESRIMPYRITFVPPAFVETFPPNIQVSLAPISTGKNISFSLATF